MLMSFIASRANFLLALLVPVSFTVAAREKSRLEEMRDIVFTLYAQGNAEKAENDSGDKGEYTPEVRGQV